MQGASGLLDKHGVPRSEEIADASGVRHELCVSDESEANAIRVAAARCLAVGHRRRADSQLAVVEVIWNVATYAVEAFHARPVV